MCVVACFFSSSSSDYTLAVVHVVGATGWLAGAFECITSHHPSWSPSVFRENPDRLAGYFIGLDAAIKKQNKKKDINQFCWLLLLLNTTQTLKIVFLFFLTKKERKSDNNCVTSCRLVFVYLVVSRLLLLRKDLCAIVVFSLSLGVKRVCVVWYTQKGREKERKDKEEEAESFVRWFFFYQQKKGIWQRRRVGVGLSALESAVQQAHRGEAHKRSGELKGEGIVYNRHTPHYTHTETHYTTILHTHTHRERL